MKRSSLVWKYFAKIDEKQVQCKLCEDRLSDRGGTGSMMSAANTQQCVNLNNKTSRFQLLFSLHAEIPHQPQMSKVAEKTANNDKLHDWATKV